MARDDETRIDHESFGFIRASRVSGHTALFDSALKHQHYVTVTIGTAQQIRRFNQGRIFPERELITVAMSESQFAGFITSMNVGSGAPCTLTRVMGKGIAPPPEDINTRETFEREIREKAEAMNATLSAALAELAALGAKKSVTKAEIASVTAKVAAAQQDLVANMPFMMSQFAENIEELTERAKMDLNAHAAHLGRLGAGDATAPTFLTDGTVPK